MPDTPEPAQATDESDDEECDDVAGDDTEKTTVLEELKPVEFLRACQAGAEPTVLKIFSGNAPLNEIINTQMGDDGKLPLGVACEANNLAAAKNLIALGADPKATDRAGKTAVEYIPEDGDTNLAQILVNAGVEIPANAPVYAAYKEVTDGRMTPISALCLQDLEKMVDELNASELSTESILKACKQANKAYTDAETSTIYRNTLEEMPELSIESLMAACCTFDAQHENALARLGGEAAAFDVAE